MNPTVRKILIGAAIGVPVLWVLSYGLGYWAGGIDARDPGTISDNPWLPVVFLVFVALGMIVGLWVTVVWMRSIDEAAREAHKSAWFWGGTGGMAVGFMIAFMALLPGAESLSLPGVRELQHPAAHMAMGAFLMTLIMVAGYTVAWIVWWLRRR